MTHLVVSGEALRMGQEGAALSREPNGVLLPGALSPFSGTAALTEVLNPKRVSRANPSVTLTAWSIFLQQ